MLNLTGGYGSNVIASCYFYEEIRLKNKRNSAEKLKDSFWVAKGFVLEGKRTPFEE